jgi:serine protease Do
MKHALLPALLAGALAVAAGTAAAQSNLPDFTKLVEDQGPTVVNISTTQTPIAHAGSGSEQNPPQMDEDDPFYDFFRRFMPRQPNPGVPHPDAQSLGSGFIISQDGYILTNAHVVEGADEITVKLTDKRELKAKLIGSDRRTDVAVIKIDATGLPAVKVGDTTKLKVGEWVLAIGSPYGFENTVTAGIVSAKGRSLPQENFVPFIQTDVAINPGNSGGPLFNLRGEVIGVNSQIYSRTGGYMGLSFAIPIDVAMDIEQQLRTSGRISRGRIGVVIQEVSKELADSFGLPKPNGALVNQVEKGGPADKAGVEAGDIILKYDGRPVVSSSDLPRMVGGTKPGTHTQLQVWRKGSAKDLNVAVGELPDERIAQHDHGHGNGQKSEAVANRLGLVMSEANADQRQRLGLSGGLVVDDVKGTPRGDVRPGDIVLSLTAKGQTTDLKSVDQFNKLLAALDKSTTMTLQIRRGDTNVFATIRGE